MIRRLIAALAAACFAWLGCLAFPQAAAAAAPLPVADYTYDDHPHPEAVACVASERGPPAAHDHHAISDAVDPWSHGVSARPNTTPPLAATTYDDPPVLAHGDSAGSTTREQVRRTDGELSPHRRSQVAAKYGDEVVEGIGDSRTYIDLTKGGSIRNVGTNATHTEFADNLTAGGWISRTSKDGAVQIFQRDGAKYVLRERAGSYSGWTADFTPAGAEDVTC